MGGIPSLANLYDKESMLKWVYDQAPSLDETSGIRPQPSTKIEEGTIELPILDESCHTLPQTVPVDYSMPGCPPVVDQVWNVFQDVLAGKLSEKGSVIGVEPKTNCDACVRKKGQSGFKITEFMRPHEVNLDPEKCFLTQGVICYGPATRSGCGLPCVNANFPCRGCYGAPEGVEDQGAKLLSAVAALIDTQKPEEVEKIMNSIIDPLGTFYRFGVASSILNELKYKTTVKK